MSRAVAALLLAFAAMAVLAPSVRAAERRPTLSVVAVCGDKGLREERTRRTLHAGDSIELTMDGGALRTAATGSAWLVTPSGASVFVGPKSQVRFRPGEVALSAGIAEVLTAEGPIATVSGAAPRSTLAPRRRALLSADVPDSRILPARCLPRRALVPLRLVPIERPDPAAVAAGESDFASALASTTAGELGDTVTSCGCIESAGSGPSGGDVSGGAALPEVERQRSGTRTCGH